MKNKLIVSGIVFSVLATLMAVANTMGMLSDSFLERRHIGPSAFFIGLLSFSLFIAAKLWNEKND